MRCWVRLFNSEVRHGGEAVLTCPTSYPTSSPTPS